MSTRPTSISPISRAFFLALIPVILVLAPGHRPKNSSGPLPPLILWAWERPEDLRFVDPAHTAVAFLAANVELSNGDTVIHPRMQPLRVAEGTPLIAVIRIETPHTATAARPASFSRTPDQPRSWEDLTADQLQRSVSAIAHSACLPRVVGVQIDFDVTRSQRGFYRALLLALRRSIPAMPISITALASWCYDDDWLAGLPIDDAIPMLFRMGADTREIRQRLASGRDFREPLCRSSLGVSTDEPWLSTLPARRLYVFNPHSWTEHDELATLMETRAWR